MAGVSVAGADAGSVAAGGCAPAAAGPWLDELGLGDGVAVDDGAEDVADAASTPVMVGAAEDVATAAAGVWPADRDDRFVRKKTMPTSATTASAMTATRRSQYTRGDRRADRVHHRRDGSLAPALFPGATPKEDP